MAGLFTVMKTLNYGLVLITAGLLWEELTRIYQNFLRHFFSSPTTFKDLKQLPEGHPQHQR